MILLLDPAMHGVLNVTTSEHILALYLVTHFTWLSVPAAVLAQHTPHEASAIGRDARHEVDIFLDLSEAIQRVRVTVTTAAILVAAATTGRLLGLGDHPITSEQRLVQQPQLRDSTLRTVG